MSPEQARGEPVDFRSDQFSFGSVLYEMATGRRAFKENTRIDTLSAVLHDDPEPIARLRPGIPPPLRWVVERCHAKAAGDRYESTGDLAREIRGIREHLSEVSGQRGPGRAAGASQVRAPAAAILAALLAGRRALGGARARPRPAQSGPEFRRLTFRSGVVTRALFMQKSNSILYTASWDGQSPRTYLTLPEAKGADRSLDAETQVPMAFSEDGSEVLVQLGRSRPTLNYFGTLAWWPALGGKARPFLENSGWADWAKKGRFVAVVQEEGSQRVLQVRDAAGKLLRPLFRTTRGHHLRFHFSGRNGGRVHPSPLPHGRCGGGPDRLGGRNAQPRSHARVRALRGPAVERAHGRGLVHREPRGHLHDGALGRGSEGPGPHGAFLSRLLSSAGRFRRRLPLRGERGGDGPASRTRRRALRGISPGSGSSLVADISPDGQVDSLPRRLFGGQRGRLDSAARRKRGHSDLGRRSWKVFSRRSVGRRHEPCSFRSAAADRGSFERRQEPRRHELHDRRLLRSLLFGIRRAPLRSGRRRDGARSAE